MGITCRSATPGRTGKFERQGRTALCQDTRSAKALLANAYTEAGADGTYDIRARNRGGMCCAHCSQPQGHRACILSVVCPLRNFRVVVNRNRSFDGCCASIFLDQIATKMTIRRVPWTIHCSATTRVLPWLLVHGQF